MGVDKNNITLSLGAGVQSSVLALMAAKGAAGLPRPLAAIFADTQAEPAGVYRWLAWLEDRLPFPVVRATQGNLTEDSTRLRTAKTTGNTYLKPSLPVFTLIDGKKGMMMRQCTQDYKIAVVKRATRVIMRQHGLKRVVQWIGISTDEATRMKDSRVKYIENTWPLADLGMSRQDCLDWARSEGMPTPPRSACVYCPYHNDREWMRLQRDDPDEFTRAVEYERRLSAAAGKATSIRASAVFLHSSRVPLDQVRFDPSRQMDLFQDECEGMCGL